MAPRSDTRPGLRGGGLVPLEDTALASARGSAHPLPARGHGRLGARAERLVEAHRRRRRPAAAPVPRSRRGAGEPSLGASHATRQVRRRRGSKGIRSDWSRSGGRAACQSGRPVTTADRGGRRGRWATVPQREHCAEVGITAATGDVVRGERGVTSTRWTPHRRSRRDRLPCPSRVRAPQQQREDEHAPHRHAGSAIAVPDVSATAAHPGASAVVT